MGSAYAIPTHKISDRLRFENPWWKTNTIDAAEQAMPRRLYFQLFMPFVANIQIKRAVILMGLRRVGLRQAQPAMSGFVPELVEGWCLSLSKAGA